MKYPLLISMCLVFVVFSAGCSSAQDKNDRHNADSSGIDWSNELTPEQFRILRQCGTEPPFTGAYWDHHDKGVYHCAGCSAPLFLSADKYESGSGWPSFFDALDSSNIKTKVDRKHGMVRTELLCALCGGHLGHLFDDGPPPSGLRYCINSVSLQFEKDTLSNP